MADPTVIAIGDVHSPWVYWRTVEKISAVIQATRSTRNVHVVQLGDLYDMYSWSRFPRTHSLYTPQAEVKKGREICEKIWERFTKANPKAKFWQIRGNHDVRPYKRVLERMPEIEPMMGLDQLWRFEKVETVLDETEDLLIGGNSYTHGFTKFGKHVSYTGRNTSVGHLHVLGITYVRHAKRTLWEACAGLVGNPKSVPLSYGALNRYGKTQQGVLKVEGVYPRIYHFDNP